MKVVAKLAATAALMLIVFISGLLFSVIGAERSCR
jgi:hypothetical protein